MEREYVGIDLHRRRSVIYRMNSAGEKLGCVRIDNDPVTFAAEVARAGPGAEVVIEATYGWYWAVDVLESLEVNVHLAHPAGNDWGKRRVKNDERDARDLADLLRLGRLAEAWIAPREVRELRELVRFRHKLVGLRTGLKAQVQAVLAKEGVTVKLSEWWGPTGTAELDRLDLGAVYTNKVESLRDLVAVYDREIALYEREIHLRCKHEPGYWAIQAIHGVGPTLAAIFVAEVGDVTRFPNADALCSWAGLTPRHRESDTTVHRGAITKQGSPLLRWAAIEAVSRFHGGDHLAETFHRIAERRGRNKARTAVARKVLTLVYFGLRDGEIRCLRQRPETVDVA